MTVKAQTNRLQRAISARENKPEMPYMISNFSVQRVDRPKISAPILLATTNVHTFTALRLEEARRIRKVTSVSSNSSHASDASSTRSRSTSITTASSVGSSPHTSHPPSPQSTNEREKFNSPSKNLPQLKGPRRSASYTELRSQNPAFTNPIVPKRAPSHSKLAHENVARQRTNHTIQHMKSWQEPARSLPISQDLHTATITTSGPETVQANGTDATDFATSHVQASHPFGKELEQLDEVAEEFGGAIRDAEREQDEIVMSQRKLVKFSAADYLADLQPIFSRFFAPLISTSRTASKCPDGWL